VDIDPLLDFFSALRDELAGRTTGAGGDVKRLNLVVRDYFERVVLTSHSPGGDMQDVQVLPMLNPAATRRLLTGTSVGTSSTSGELAVTHDQGDVIPPLRAIEAAGNAPAPW
jgi:hypothetical protein